jgi:hypothetical protein
VSDERRAALEEAAAHLDGIADRMDRTWADAPEWVRDGPFRHDEAQRTQGYRDAAAAVRRLA